VSSSKESASTMRRGVAFEEEVEEERSDVCT